MNKPRKNSESALPQPAAMAGRKAEPHPGRLAPMSPEEMLRIKGSVFDASIAANSIANVNGLITGTNDAFLRTWGYSHKEQVVGKPISHFIADQNEVLAILAALDGTGHWEGEYTARRSDDSTFMVLGLATCLRDEDGKVIGYQSAVMDISGRKRAEQILKAELDQAQRLAMVSEISGGIIHQLGQPLSAMGANVAAAIVRLDGCELNRCGSLEIIKDIESDVERMRNAVTQLRALVSPGQVTRVPIELNALVADVLSLLRQEAANSQFRLAIEAGKDLPPVLANAVQLHQVIFNLARNAFDACAACPPERRRGVITTRAVAGVGVELSVRDAGPGISPAAMNRLFTPFFTTKPQGMGIGLRLSRTIVEAHGGSIEGGNNSDGIGATFRVVLPVNPESCPAKI